jgi:hypothetical protein
LSGDLEFGGLRTPFSNASAANPYKVLSVAFVVFLLSILVVAWDLELDFERELPPQDLVIVLNRNRFSRVSLDETVVS